MMADNHLLNDNDGGDWGGGDDIFVYTGGEQQVPRDVRRVRIAENVDTILARAFRDCYQLIEVEGHDRLKKIEYSAFNECYSLRSVTKMTGLIEIEQWAFSACRSLSELEFDKLDIIGNCAFVQCNFLRTINMRSIRRVGPGAFMRCEKLTCAMFGEKLERIEQYAFYECIGLRHIIIPLKDNLIIENNAFADCENFSRVDVIGGIRETITSLHLESWRNEMLQEIGRINLLPNIRAVEKTRSIKQWVERVLQRMEHYKTEHQILLKEAMTLLELALWKVKLLDERGEKNRGNLRQRRSRLWVKIDAEAARKEHRVTCGASAVIKNVLPFLDLS